MVKISEPLVLEIPASEGLVMSRVRIKEKEGGKGTREVGAGIQIKNLPSCHSQIPTPKCQWYRESSRLNRKQRLDFWQSARISLLFQQPAPIYEGGVTAVINLDLRPNAEGSNRRRTSGP